MQLRIFAGVDTLRLIPPPFLPRTPSNTVMIMKKDVGDFKTEAKANEVYETKHSFEVDSLKGLELSVEVFDEKLAEHTVSASVTGAKALGDTSKLLLGSCKIHLDKHNITDDPKGVKCPLSNTFVKEGKPEIFLIFTLNP